MHIDVICCFDGVASTQVLHDGQYLLNVVQKSPQENTIDYSPMIAVPALS